MQQTSNALPALAGDGEGVQTAGETELSVPPTADVPAGYIRGVDGKVYPERPLPAATREQIAGRVHYLSHELRLSVRQIVARLAEHGFRASVGTVHAWLRQWRCPACSGAGNGTPEQRAEVTPCR